MTPVALAEARHAQAVADRETAERALLAVMASIDPRPTTPIIDGILPRRFEALLEGTRPHRELATAYSAFRRAQRVEAKARSAAYRAQWATSGATIPAIQRDLDPAYVHQRLREMRAAA